MPHPPITLEEDIVIGVHYAPGAHTSPRWPGVMNCHNHPRRTGSHLWEGNMPMKLLQGVGVLGVGRKGIGRKAGPVTHQVWPHAHIVSGCSWQQWMSMFLSVGHIAQHCGHQNDADVQLQQSSDPFPGFVPSFPQCYG